MLSIVIIVVINVAINVVINILLSISVVIVDIITTTTTGTFYMITTISMVDQLGLNWIVEGVNFEGVSTPQTLPSGSALKSRVKMRLKSNILRLSYIFNKLLLFHTDRQFLSYTSKRPSLNSLITLLKRLT